MAGGFSSIRTVGVDAPFRWLAGGWRDFGAAPLSFMLYGLALGLVSLALCWGIVVTNGAFWVLALTCGFVFLAPMLAMGLYEAGRIIETGGKPSLGRMLFVRDAVRQDIAYLGLALLLIYFLWSRFAQIVYGLSTWRLHRTVEEFVTFAVATKEGHTMLISGSIVGGVMAFFTYCLVVVAAPMLLDRRSNVFQAVATSFGAVSQNFAPLLLWAVLIVFFLIAAAMTGFLGFTLIFPWLGLASWRAYRELVDERVA